MRIWLLFAACGLALLGCGGAGAPPASRPPTALERVYPVLSKIPGDVSYAVVAVRLGDLVTAGREIGAGAALLHDLMQPGSPSLEAGIASVLGINLLSPDELVAAGLDLDRSAAVFSQGLWPTAVLPVADQDALTRLIDRRLPQAGVLVRERHGVPWFTWRSAEDLALHWAVLEDVLVVRVSLADEADSAWTEMDAILGKAKGNAGRRSLGEAPEVETMTRVLRGRLGLAKEPAVIGLFHLERVLRAAAGYMPAMEAVALGPCWRLLTPLGGPLAMAIDVDWSRVRAALSIPLVPEVVQALGSHTALPPPGWNDYQKAAGLYASAAVDVTWLLEHARAIECPLLEVPDQILAHLPPNAPTAGFVAVEDLQPDNLAGRGALHLALPGPGFVESLLGQIPQRSLFERRRTIAGTSVTRLAVPVVMKSELFYRLSNQAFTAALGEDVMKAILSPGPGQGRGASEKTAKGPRELGALRLIPGQVPHFEELLAQLISSSYARALMQRLARYEEAHLYADLHEDTVVLRAAVHVAR